MTTAPVAFRSAQVRLGVHADALALVTIAALLGALTVLTWGTWGDLDSDTGYDVVAGGRVADGELPYRDFTYYYGPLAPALTGLGAAVGGFGFWPAVALGLVIAFAIVGATYALARVLVGPLGAFLAAAITAAVAFIPNNYSYVLPHTYAATLGTLLVLVLLLALWRYAAAERSRWAVSAGVVLGLVFLTKPEPAAAALFAVLVWLVLRARRGLGARHAAALIAAPAVAIPASVYGAFLAVVSPGTLLLDNLWPVDELRAGGDVLVKARAPFTAASLAELGGRAVVYALGAAALVALGWALARYSRFRRPLIGAVAVAAVAVGTFSLLKPDGVRDGFYWAWGWIPVGAVAALALLVWRFWRRERSVGSQLALLGAAALTVLAGSTYASFVFHGWRPQMAVYYAPLAAILLARIHLVELARRRETYALGVLWIGFLAAAGVGMTLKDARAESETVRGAGGTLAETPAEAALYGAVLEEISARTAVGEPILVTPLLTGLYVLSERESPLPQLTTLPSALPSAAEEREAVRRLDRAGVRLVVTDRREWPGYGHTAFGDSFQRLVAAWLERDFDRVRTIRGGGDSDRALDVWVRSGS